MTAPAAIGAPNRGTTSSAKSGNVQTQTARPVNKPSEEIPVRPDNVCLLRSPTRRGACEETPGYGLGRSFLRPPTQGEHLQGNLDLDLKPWQGPGSHPRKDSEVGGLTVGLGGDDHRTFLFTVGQQHHILAGAGISVRDSLALKRLPQIETLHHPQSAAVKSRRYGENGRLARSGKARPRAHARPLLD